MPKVKHAVNNCIQPIRKMTTSQDTKLQILAANLRKQFAKNVPFTDSYIVNKGIGDFVVGDSVKDLSVAEILIKLLGLTKTDAEPESPPDLPPIIGDSTIVDAIIQEKAPLYQINDNFELVEVEYSYKSFDEVTYNEEPKTLDTTFYQKIDNSGRVVESGYQHCTEMQDMYYLVMLPEELVVGENVKIQTWSKLESCWKDVTSPLTNDYNIIVEAFAEVGLEAPQKYEGYTLWVDLTDIDPGTNYRYIIIE